MLSGFLPVKSFGRGGRPIPTSGRRFGCCRHRTRLVRVRRFLLTRPLRAILCRAVVAVVAEEELKTVSSRLRCDGFFLFRRKLGFRVLPFGL